MVLDSQGGILSEYWHSGHLPHLRLADLDGDGTEEILAAGVSEAYRQATLVVLDLTGFFGASQAPPDSPEEFADMVPAVEKALVLFPKSCITRRFEPYNRVAALRVASDFIEAQVSQTHTDSGLNLLYQLNRRLEVVGLTVSEAFEKRHTELEAEGKLDHNLSAGEIAALKQVRVIRRL